MGPACLHGFYQIDTVMGVICMGLRELRLRDAVFYMGVIAWLIGLLIFGCVLHGLYRFVDMWLCCMGVIVLLICLCVACVLLCC